jgi:hypothetical protein
MNIKLVESLVQIVQSLPQEERQIFEEKLFFDTQQVTTQDIMNLTNKSQSFDFLYDEPDIYTLEDGKAI